MLDLETKTPGSMIAPDNSTFVGKASYSYEELMRMAAAATPFG